ncbi:MAG: glutamate-1-semialdehyde 2,1-aminomutase [Thermoanaerobaculia bacterium]|nr:glutamate-1-semialdehyde 2,1-aminomutase [Thermoanaerobaculia bacterium]
MSAGPKSKQLFERAREVMPGGVNSPVRAFRAVGGTPLVIERAEGAHLYSVDGDEYLDFVCSWGPLILGHAHPEVVEAVVDAIRRGTTYGAPTPGEVELATHVVDAYPAIEQIRCVSSGTEATMSAVRLARGATGRDLIVKFEGCYHGHVDALLISAGSGLVTFGKPSSEGVTPGMVESTRVIPLDDEAQLEALFAEVGERIAGVVLEPIPANNGLLLQRPEWLGHLRQLTRDHGALLIFDEVISGFRVGPGGAAEMYGIQPDIAAFGKVIGGGLPVGAFGASKEIMGHLAPNGGVYQAGTLSGNPVAMAAGVTTLRYLKQNDGWQRLEELGRYLDTTLGPVLEGAEIPVRLVRVGSVFWMALGCDSAPRSSAEIDGTWAETYRHLFHHLLEKGIAIAPSMYEVGFLSLAHRREHIDRLAEILGEALAGRPDGV